MNNYFRILTLALQTAATMEQIQPLHDKARFTAIQAALGQELQLGAATFFANDKIANAIVTAVNAAIATLDYDTLMNPTPVPVATQVATSPQDAVSK
jgi:hypothetical protein